MHDLIRRQDAIDAISNYTVSSPPYFSAWTDRLVSAIKDDLVDDIENIYPAQQWIPVSERLPEVGETVLLACKEYGFNCCEYMTTKIGVYNTNCGNILAWMPLPEPYREEKE